MGSSSLRSASPTVRCQAEKTYPYRMMDDEEAEARWRALRAAREALTIHYAPWSGTWRAMLLASSTHRWPNTILLATACWPSLAL